MKIALTGGIACGKSLFAKFLRELGIQCLDADDVVHGLEGPGGAATGEIVRRFGGRVEGLVGGDGGIDRGRLAAAVFSDAGMRKELEGILLPMVRERMAEFAAGGGREIRVASIPLLFEAHWEEDYDIILCIASGREEQLRRMMETRGYSRAHAEARLAAQLPVDEKAKRADFTVWNNGTTGQLQREAGRLVEWLKKRQEENDERRIKGGGGGDEDRGN